MSVNVPIDAPLEVKKKIAKRLQKKGALKKIERKIKLGMMVAVEEIRSDPSEKTHLERLPMKNASVNELKALQAIYAYLAENNMTYTLSTLLEETCVKRNPSNKYDILEVLAEMNEDEGDSFNDNDDDSYDEPPKRPVKQTAKRSQDKRRKDDSFDLDYSDGF